MDAAQIHRWTLNFAGFEYETLYEKIKENGNVVGLSRLPLKECIDVLHDNLLHKGHPGIVMMKSLTRRYL